MKAVVYRPVELHGSWRPRSLGDMRGPRFPEAYSELVTLDIGEDVLEEASEQYDSALGDVILLFDEDGIANAFAAGPYNWERIAFGSEWKSPL